MWTREFGVDVSKTRLVLHGIDHVQFRPMPHVKRRDDLIVACASADVPLKGLIYLIRAYAELLKTRPDLKLKVIGRLREGNTSYELRQLGIMDKVEFVSGVTDEDITTLYNEATIAVSPSVYEGFGFPCGEAMSCGTPVIATNGGSLPEVVGDAGIVVQHSNPPALAEAIAKMLDNPEMRAAYGRAGRERILAKFKWERAARECAEIYRQTIENADNRLERASGLGTASARSTSVAARDGMSMPCTTTRNATWSGSTSASRMCAGRATASAPAPTWTRRRSAPSRSLSATRSRFPFRMRASTRCSVRKCWSTFPTTSRLLPRSTAS